MLRYPNILRFLCQLFNPFHCGKSGEKRKENKTPNPENHKEHKITHNFRVEISLMTK